MSIFAASRITGILPHVLENLNIKGIFTGSAERINGAPMYTPVDLSKLMVMKDLTGCSLTGIEGKPDIEVTLLCYKESDFERALKEYEGQHEEETSENNMFSLVVWALKNIEERAQAENMTNISWPVLSSVVSKLTNISDENIDTLYEEGIVTPKEGKKGYPLYTKRDVVKLMLCKRRELRGLSSRDLRKIMDKIDRLYKDAEEFAKPENGI